MNELMLSFLLGVFFIALGYLSEKKPQILAGYDKNNPDKESPKRIKKVLIAMGMVLLIGCTLSYIFNLENLFWIFLLAIPLVIPFFVTKSKKSKYIWAGIIIILFIFSYYASKDPSIEINDSKIAISGLYGEDIPIDEIEKVKLLDAIPEIELRTNGFALSHIRKGYFLIKSMGQVKVFTQSSNKPFIFIETTRGKYLVNTRNSKETIDIYEKISLYYDKN